MENITLREDIDFMIQCTKELQLSKPLFKRYCQYFDEIYLYCIAREIHIFKSQDAITFYKQKELSGMKKFVIRESTKIAFTVAEYFKTGKFVWKKTTISEYSVSDSFEELLTHFGDKLSETLSNGTVRVSLGITRQFLHFLEQNDILYASDITTENVLNFIRQEAPRHKNSMAKLVRTIRKFICFLRSEGLVDLNADRYLTASGRYRQKSLPCFTDKEIHSIFSQIDRSTDQGRRDYAIFLIALRTGMRASDISKLKLVDINWSEKTICVVQKKTKTSVQLPLPIDVGNAIADYIIHSRYRTDNPYVFLRLKSSPLVTPIDPTSFNTYLQKYIKKAGIQSVGWDGKSFHALRRTSGTKMITSGVSVSTVAQILGHTNIESAMRYIALDTKNLRVCCLDLGSMHTRKEGLI